MKNYGLIGYPLTHSFSKKFFTDKFSKEGIAANYINYELEKINQLPNVFLATKISGLNVTIPYKKSVIPYLDELDEISLSIGAVNTILPIEKKGNLYLKGYNTDVYGFEESLTKLKSLLPKKALILGSGGASSAVAFVLDKLEIHYQFVSRNPKNDQISYQAVNADLLKNHQLIINASPVGTFPKVNLSPELPYEEINETHILFDLIYNPIETLFLKEGKRRGAIISNGLKMLEYQAEKSWEIWNK